MNFLIKNTFNTNNFNKSIYEDKDCSNIYLSNLANSGSINNPNISLSNLNNISLLEIDYSNKNLVNSLNSSKSLDYTTSYNLSNNILDDLYDNKIYDIILKKKKLIETVKNLSNIEYYEIFNIFKEDNTQYTENANGVFINLQNIGEHTLDKIFNFIDYIKQKKVELNQHDEFINNAKKNISSIKKEINILTVLEKDNYNNYYESDSDISVKNNNELLFSSDEDEDIESKISLKKKKNKYVGKKAKIIKSIKNDQDNKLKNN
jgi:hypothetical protein